MTPQEIQSWMNGTSERRPSDAEIAAAFADQQKERISQMVEAGVKYVQFIGTGNGDECPACAAVIDKRYPIRAAPEFPPPGCTCDPYFQCLLIAVE